MGTLQEKFQIVADENDLSDRVSEQGWVDAKDARRTRPAVSGYASFTTALGRIADREPWQAMPIDLSTHINFVSAHQGLPTTGLEEVVNEFSPLVTSGRSDRTVQATPEDLLRGFAHHDMVGPDDQYSDEHKDHFYGEAVGTDDSGEKITGFVERNNYLDRL